MSHIEKMAVYKNAAEKQQNDHAEVMAKVKLEQQNLQTKNSAINHSAVKSQTLIPGQFIEFWRWSLNFRIVILNAGAGEKTMDKDTTQFLRTHLRYDQTQVTSVPNQQSNSSRDTEITFILENDIKFLRYNTGDI